MSSHDLSARIGALPVGVVGAHPDSSSVVCRSGQDLDNANPAFGPTEQGIMLEMSEIDRVGSIWIDSDTFEKNDFFDPGEPKLETSKLEKSELWELKIRDFEGSKNALETS